MTSAPTSLSSTPPSDGRCLLFTLADIELQLVCHFLGGAEIMQFGLTATRIHHAVDSPYAWEHAMTHVTFCREPFLLPSRGLRRHARVALKWLIQDDSRMPGEHEIQRLIDAMPATGVLRSFDVRDFPMRQAQWNKLIEYPAIQVRRGCMQAKLAAPRQTEAGCANCLADFSLRWLVHCLIAFRK